MERSEGIAGRCLWCGQVRDDLCAMPLRVARNSRWTLLASVLAVLLVIGGGMAGSDVVIAAGMLVLGAGILLFPFCTPEAVRRLGALRAIQLARAIGLVVAVAATGGLAYTILAG